MAKQKKIKAAPKAAVKATGEANESNSAIAKAAAARIAAENAAPPAAAIAINAEECAVERGHVLGQWSTSADESMRARCTNCQRVVSVVRSQFIKDQRGFGGTAISFPCDAAPIRSMPAPDKKSDNATQTGGTTAKRRGIMQNANPKANAAKALKAPKAAAAAAAAPKAKRGAKATAPAEAPKAKRGKAPVEAPAATEAKRGPRGPRANSIGTFIVERHNAGDDNAKIAAALMDKFPESTVANDESKAKKHVAWYIWNARKKGLI